MNAVDYFFYYAGKLFTLFMQTTNHQIMRVMSKMTFY